MNRWEATERRDELTAIERQILLEELQRVCGPRPPGTRMDLRVASWRWAHNWIRRMVGHNLRKREEPATREEVLHVVARYADAAFENYG